MFTSYLFLSFQAEGRLLPPEKIKFGSQSVIANPQADWGREAVKESVITPVSKFLRSDFVVRFPSTLDVSRQVKE